MTPHVTSSAGRSLSRRSGGRANPCRRATSPAMRTHGPVTTRLERDSSHRRRHTPTIRSPRPAASPAIQSRTSALPPLGRPGFPFGLSKAMIVCASLPSVAEPLLAATRVEAAVGAATVDPIPRSTCHDGVTGPSSGIVAAQATAAARIECRNAAERRRMIRVAASATTTMTEALAVATTTSIIATLPFARGR